MADPIEAADSVSPGSATFSATGGARVQATYYVAADDVEEWSEVLLGSVRPRGDGRLRRVLPRASPQWPWSMVESLTIRGHGKHQRIEIDPAEVYYETTPIIQQYAEYEEYIFECSLVDRPYPVAGDDQILMSNGGWFDDDGNFVDYEYATEWERWTDWPRYPADEFIQFRQGQMAFRTQRGIAAAPATVAGNPHNAMAPGLPRIHMQRELLRLKWYQVPYSYLESRRSYLSRFKWRVNQNEWMGFEPGELLYEGHSFDRRVTPPFPEADFHTISGWSSEKVVDVEMLLRICRTGQSDVPSPDNPNWIAHGHNLFPWAGDRRFYYATSFKQGSPTDERYWVPTFLSAPFELLFTDPDYVQDLGRLG